MILAIDFTRSQNESVLLMGILTCGGNINFTRAGVVRGGEFSVCG